MNQQSIANLSFAAETADGIDLWPEGPAVDYATGTTEGRIRADEVFGFVTRNQAPFVFGHVAGAIVSKGRYGSREIGFFQRTAELALEGSAALA